MVISGHDMDTIFAYLAGFVSDELSTCLEVEKLRTVRCGSGEKIIQVFFL